MKKYVKKYTPEQKKEILDGIDSLFFNLKKESYVRYKSNIDFIVIPEDLAKKYCFFISKNNKGLLLLLLKELKNKKLEVLEEEKDGIVYLYASDESNFIDCVRVIKYKFKNLYSRLVFPTTTPLRRKNKKRVNNLEEENITRI